MEAAELERCVQERVCAVDAILPRGVLVRVVADAAGRGYEDHSARCHGGQRLGGVVGAAAEVELERAGADDARDDPDLRPVSLELRPLLDVELEVAGEGLRLAARLAEPCLREAGPLESVEQRLTAAARLVQGLSVSAPVSASLPSSPTRVPSSSVKSIASSAKVRLVSCS